MRIIGRFRDQRDVGGLVDSLRNTGLDRKDMIISDFNDDKGYDNFKEAAENVAFIKTERDGLGEYQSFASGIKGFTENTGIIVAVETSKHNTNRVREIMEQSGAVEILQD